MSDLHELQVAADINGEQTPGSGAGKRFKGDVLNAVVMVEGKSTLDDSITLTAGLLRATCREAAFMKREPVVSLAFITGDPEVASTLILDAVLYVFPAAKAKDRSVAFDAVKITRNEVLSLSEGFRKIFTFKMQKGFPMTWRIGWARDLPKRFLRSTVNAKQRSKPNLT